MNEANHTSKKEMEMALSAIRRCRSYDQNTITENECVIVVLGEEIERQRAEIERLEHALAAVRSAIRRPDFGLEPGAQS